MQNVSASDVVTLCAALITGTALGDTFHFGSNQNNLNGAASATISAGDVTTQLSAAIPGTLLSETSSFGMGIDSRPISSDGDRTPAVFNILRGAGPFAGISEAAYFSFNTPGILSGINFDGVTDDRLEYFTLRASNGARFHFFDAQAN